MNRQDLASMDDSKLINALSALLPTSIDQTTLDMLPDPLKLLWLLQDLEAERAIGGMLGYLFNGSGRHASPAAGALRQFADHDRPFTTPSLAHYGLSTPYASLPRADTIVELTDELRQKLYDEEDFGGKLVAYLRVQLDDITGDQKATDSQQRCFGDRANFAVEIGAYLSPILRDVDLWAGGQRLTTKDNAAYVPAFAHCLQTSAAHIRSGRIPPSPFPGMTAEQMHRLLHADNESNYRENSGSCGGVRQPTTSPPTRTQKATRW